MAYHEFSVEGQDKIFGAKVKLDGKEIDFCTGYNISHEAGCLPRVEISLMPIVPKVGNLVADVRISNLYLLAKIMDEADFKVFCGIWNKVHKADEV